MADAAERRYSEIRTQVATLTQEDRSKLNVHFQGQRADKQTQLKELATTLVALLQLGNAAPGLFESAPSLRTAQAHLEKALEQTAKGYVEAAEVADDVARATADLASRPEAPKS